MKNKLPRKGLYNSMKEFLDMKKIILATTSKGRLDWFSCLGIKFTAEGSDVNEYFYGRPEDPKKLTVQLAKMKAEDVARKHEEGIVIGFDSVGYFKGKILEKPKTEEEAFDMLKSLSGKKHEWLTGMHMKDIETGKSFSDLTKTTITFRKLTDEEIRNYLKKEPRYKQWAVAYNPLGNYGASFIENFEGSYSSQFGVPLDVIVKRLREFGVEI